MQIVESRVLRLDDNGFVRIAIHLAGELVSVHSVFGSPRIIAIIHQFLPLGIGRDTPVFPKDCMCGIVFKIKVMLAVHGSVLRIRNVLGERSVLVSTQVELVFVPPVPVFRHGLAPGESQPGASWGGGTQIDIRPFDAQAEIHGLWNRIADIHLTRCRELPINRDGGNDRGTLIVRKKTAFIGIHH